MTGSRTALPQALALSIALHALLVFTVAPRLAPTAPKGPPPVTVLAARLEAVPERAVVKPAAPPEVLKDTLDAPQAKPLPDPIKPQPRRRVADKDQFARTPKPKPEAPPPALAARSEPRGQGLDLRVPKAPRAERLSPEELRHTLGRLSEELLYPADALRRGLEGEVTILVELGEGGRILDASIASGSGHESLDEAAVRAVKKLGSLGPSTANRTILLPVRFRIL